MSDTDVLFSSQDFILQFVKIIRPDGAVLDIKNLVVEFNYFEDLFSNAITGAVVVNDSNDLITFLSLTGNDYISFILEKPGLQCSIERVFKIYTVSERTLINDTNEGYFLHFCSEELMLSEQYRVSKSYKNHKVSQIVQDICENYLNIGTSKSLNNAIVAIEETKNTLNLVVPNLKPIEAINWLCNYAQSQSSLNPSTFLFFQDNRGYNFKSIQTLCSGPVYKTYTYEPKNVVDDTDTEKYITNVLSYEIVEQFNSLNSLNRGVFSNRLVSIDLISQTYQETDFDYEQYSKTAKRLNQYGILPNSKNTLGDKPNQTPIGTLRVATSIQKTSLNPYVISKNQAIKDIEIEKYVPQRLAEIGLIASQKVKLAIPGDPLMTVGKVINFNLLTVGIKSSEEGKPLDTYMSGKYLVTAVRHKADNSGVFQTVIEICKESMPNPYMNYSDYKGTLASVIGK